MSWNRWAAVAGCVALLGLQACATARSKPRGQPARLSYGTLPTARASSARRAGYGESRPSLRPSVAGLGGEPRTSVYRIKTGDGVVIHLRGIPQEQMIEDVVDDAGMVTLPFLNEVEASGLTASELERAIRRAYVERGIYKDVTVNVVLPAQSYYVRGEVRVPGRFPLVSGVTVLQAIATAGGYTEFANPRKVNILRGGKVRYVDARALEKHPERDIPLEAGDVIVVPRSVF